MARFRAALRGGALPPGVTATDPTDAARRFDVYRNNVAVSLSQALARRFPVILRLVGEDFFRALAREYLVADPPRTPVLAEWGTGFAGFLAGFPPLAPWPWMADVARIEVARGRAFHAADARSLDPAALAGTDPARLCLHLHPSLAVLRLDHPAVSIWRRHQPGAPDHPLPALPEIALILRDPGFDVPVEAIPPADAVLIEALAGGAPLAEAALAAQQVQPGHDPGPRLVRLMRAGTIVEGVSPC
ncbi:HvfC/BufC N-terminal domain-containing protein [Paracoccus liaowanqingii]|nr:putative DNA-binding domain-containing protein [Paracoccus liaowanqingii]